MKLTFLGATETVTGSKYLIEDGGYRVLVDCGLFQGTSDLRRRNWEKMPVEAAKIDAVLLTHAHIDHSGYLPRLIQDGFRGPVYCSGATFDLCKILLPDSGYLQEEDAANANRYGYSKHAPAMPLYTEADAWAALEQFVPVAFGKHYALGDGELRFSLYRAGHILGSAFIRVEDDSTSILFSGDIGRLHNPVMKPPAKIQNADYLVLESTYGDRLHNTDDPTEELGRVIRETAARGGTVLIPAFAVGRTQSILYHLYVLKSEKRIPDLPVFLDSPMAIDATGLLKTHMNEHRLSPEECAAVCRVARYAQTREDSKAINQDTNTVPKIIVSASGMATGGRVLHHLKHYLGDARNTVLLAGFQAAGTRGDRLLRGETELRIHGQDYPVLAQIAHLDTLSAHADYGEILTWLENFNTTPRRTFITHGEIDSARALQTRIQDKLGWTAEVPVYMQSVDL